MQRTRCNVIASTPATAIVDGFDLSMFLGSKVKIAAENLNEKGGFALNFH